MLTQEQYQELSKIYQLAAEAVQSGRELEYRVKGRSDDSWETTHHMLDNKGAVVVQFEYRLKAEPKLRPWTPEEVPVGALVRQKNNDHVALITRRVGEAITLGCNNSYSSKADLFNGYEFSLDSGKTWQPCGVLE